MNVSQDKARAARRQGAGGAFVGRHRSANILGAMEWVLWCQGAGYVFQFGEMAYDFATRKTIPADPLNIEHYHMRWDAPGERDDTQDFLRAFAALLPSYDRPLADDFIARAR